MSDRDTLTLCRWCGKAGLCRRYDDDDPAAFVCEPCSFGREERLRKLSQDAGRALGRLD